MERMEKPHDEPPEVQWIKSPPTMAYRSVPTSRVNIYLTGSLHNHVVTLDRLTA
jgi:hypothetical protein